MMASQREQRELAAGILVGRIRYLQATHAVAHEALRNWGHWSQDRRGIFPTQAPPSMWDQFKRDENEAYGEETEPQVTAEHFQPKAEHAPRAEYDERKAIELDERIHGPGSPPTQFREVLKAAYVSREVPEEQFPRLSGCNDDAFCERLEAYLLFVGRYVGE